MTFQIRRHLATGTLILVPLVLTLFCFLLLLGFVNNNLSMPIGRLLLSAIHWARGGGGAPPTEIPAAWASLIGVALILLLTYLTGLVGSSLLGRQVLVAAEGVIDQIPVFKTVYATVKQVVAEISPGDRRSFRKVVLVKNGSGQFHMGFLTGESRIAGDGDAAAAVRTVYLPTNHLWFGEVRVVPAADVVDIDLSVEQGISFILSCGATVPPQVKKTAS